MPGNYEAKTADKSIFFVEMKLTVTQETDYIKRAPHHQNNLTDRLRHVLLETVEAGSNVPAGAEAMIRCARSMLERGNRWKNTLGDGRRGYGTKIL
ncbi:MAG: hypothetical protein KKG76_05635 [Euryarchaeota archaeon]|nr:hypothetical protein [Euryarchaeota archaeon]